MQTRAAGIGNRAPSRFHTVFRKTRPPVGLAPCRTAFIESKRRALQRSRDGSMRASVSALLSLGGREHSDGLAVVFQLGHLECGHTALIARVDICVSFEQEADEIDST